MAAEQKKMTAAQISGLAAMLLGTLVIANDFTALTVVIPAIEKAFNADVTTAQWVITGYALIFGVFIVTGGRLADMYGRRRIFFIGMTIFGVFSVVGGLATDVWMLLIARSIMGIGGAMVWPAMLGLAYTLVPKEKAALVGGMIMAVAGFGNSMGPLLGGFFTDFADWRWIFFTNLPVAMIAIGVTYWAVADDSPENPEERIDYPGVATLSLGLFGILLLMDIGAGLGWFDPVIIGLFCGSAAFLCLFFYIERKAGDNALVPKDVMENKNFFATIMATLMVSAVFFGVLLYMPQFMMKQLGFSAIEAGAGLLPVMGMFAISSFFAAPVYDRLGPKAIVSIGAICLGVGIFILSRLDATTTYPELVPGMAIVGIGVGLFYSSITTAGITAVDPSRTSLAGAILFMFQNAGGAIGLGLNTAIVVTMQNLPDGIARAFTLDAILVLGGLLICLFFVDGPFSWEKLFSGFRSQSDTE